MGNQKDEFLSNSIEGKIVVITGANSGIGLETTKELNLRKGKIYMLCRNETKAKEAITELVKEVGHYKYNEGCDSARLIFVRCDLSDFSSVNECAEQLTKAENHIDILINNAGIMLYPRYEKTKDGHEMTWQSNHLGPFLLTERLLPLVRRSKEGRIINVSSKLHLKSKPLDLTKIDSEAEFGRLASYNKSKLANVLYARGLAARFAREGVTNVTANSLHPGVVDTNLVGDQLPAPLRILGAPFKYLFFKSANDGAMTSLYLALDEKIKHTTGKYFSDCKITRESEHAGDDQAVEALYKYSLEQVGLHHVF